MRKIGFSQKTFCKKGVVEKQPKKKIWFSKGLKDLENNLFLQFCFGRDHEQFNSSARFWFPSINVRNMIWTLQSKCAVLPSVLKPNFKSHVILKVWEKKVFFCAFWKKIRLFLTSKVTCQDKDFVTNKSLLPKSLPKLVALPTANQLLFAVLTYYIPTRQVPLPEPRLA